jgi:hypothetical protein
MPVRLQIKEEDCSPLGRLILAYLQDHGMSMNRLAELSGIPQPRLRGACFRGTCPTPETLGKLAKAMNMHHLELYTLAYEGRIAEPESVTGKVSEEMMLRALLETARELKLIPPERLPTPTQIHQALMELGFHPINRDLKSVSSTPDHLHPQTKNPALEQVTSSTGSGIDIKV